MNQAAQHFDHQAMEAAKNLAKIATSLTAETLEANGGRLINKWRMTMSDEATLKSLQRIVRDSALGKAFQDGEVFKKIPAEQEITISFYKMEDGSGVAVAETKHPGEAMVAMLNKLSLQDLDFEKGMRIRKPEKPQGKIEVVVEDGKVSIAMPANQELEAMQMECATGNLNAPMYNPIAAMDFMKRYYGGSRQTLPMNNAKNLVYAAILAATNECHPSDTQWPEGITVQDIIANKPLESPIKAVANYVASFETNKPVATLTEPDVLQSFRGFRANKP